MLCWNCKHRTKRYPSYGDYIPLPECNLPASAGDQSFCPYFEREEILEGDIWFSEEDRKKHEQWLEKEEKKWGIQFSKGRRIVEGL